MKQLDLLIILNNVKGEYLAQAQTLRAGERKPHLLHRKRALLIAALISLLLLLVGCTAALLALQKISLGRVTFPQHQQESWTMDMVSTNGYQDSVNYQATQDWLKFTTTYDADKELLYHWPDTGYMAPLAYQEYGCYTPDMKDKVDEICETYGLALSGPVGFTDMPEQYFSAVGITSLANPGSPDRLTLSEGMLYYESGSFYADGMITHQFTGRSGADKILYGYTCRSKSVFFPDTLPVWELDSADSWEYTAWDGTRLVLVQEPTQGIITADVGDFFLSIRLNFTYGGPNGDVNIQNPCIREEFEKIADAFAYQITPQKPSGALLSNFDGTEQVYANYYDAWCPGSLGSSAYDPYLQPRKMDLDGDGRRELLIWNEQTGVIYEVVTPELGGGIRCLYGYGSYALDQELSPLYLCEGNVLECDCGDLQGKSLTEFYRLKDLQLVMVECVMESWDGKFYWSECGGASSLMWREITEADYQSVLLRYPRIDAARESSVPHNAPEFDDTGAVFLPILRSQDAFRLESGGCTLAEYCAAESARMGCEVEATRYATLDMDGDGEKEAVVDFRFGTNREVMCMVLKLHHGTISGTEFYYRQMHDLKADGSFRYSGGADNAGWAKLQFSSSDFTWSNVPAADSSGEPDAEWHFLPIG